MSVATPVGDPISVSAKSGGTWYGSDVQELSKRLALLEQKVEILPSLVADAISNALLNMSCYGSPGISDFPIVAQDQYSSANPISITGLVADAHGLMMELGNALSSKLRETINFEELDRLRARVAELEKDLGFRTAVAKRLMED